ncbi:ER-derived vesicles protein erv29 [Savitreella phatthalungensis]
MSGYQRNNIGGGAYAAGRPNISAPSAGSPSVESPLDTVKQISAKVEDVLDSTFEPVKPYLPALGRFLIVVTFLEDAIRILTQWGDQLYYLQTYRGIWWGFSHLFLLANVLAMAAGSYLVVARRYTEIAIGMLLGVVVSQALGYGLIFDLNFFFRNLSVVGGLLMVLSDSMSQRKQIFAGLPTLSETDRRKYFQLAGRVLLIFLFVGFVFHGQWSFTRVIFSLIGFVACIMVVVGFKARLSATLLVLMLSLMNLLINNFWTVHHTSPQRDFLKYDFFQTLSIMGGLLLLVNMGAGDIAMDKKKVY